METWICISLAQKTTLGTSVNRLSGIIVLISCCIAGIVGCSKEQASSNNNPLRVAVLPDQTPERLKARYAPLLKYLATELDTRVELIIPSDYADMLDKFHREEFDLVRFGGFSFVKAEHKDGAIPVVMRDIDTRFSSYFVVRTDDPATGLADFRGKKLSFGSELSTSGHLMPRYFLQSKGIIATEFFASIVFSGAHDKTAYTIRDGAADIGAANAIVIDQLYRDGLLSRDQVRILWKTPPYADYVWAAARHMPDATRIRIQDAFLALSKDVPQHAEILQQLGAGNYLPANTADFASLKEISYQLGMLDGS